MADRDELADRIRECMYVGQDTPGELADVVLDTVEREIPAQHAARLDGENEGVSEEDYEDEGAGGWRRCMIFRDDP